MTTLPPITTLASAGSTNDLAMRGAREGAAHGACWLADAQTSGRGRREIGGVRRQWFSPPGVNLYMSVIARTTLSPTDAAGLTLAAALGVATAVQRVTGLEPWVKWPNDLYLGERKLAGILTEAHMEGGRLDAVIIGLGLNVNLASEDVPPELRDVLTSLRIAAGERWDRLALALEIRHALLDACAKVNDHGLSSVLDAVRALDGLNGRTVEFQRGGAWTPGTACGLNDQGALLVRDDSGEVFAMQAGEARLPR